MKSLRASIATAALFLAAALGNGCAAHVPSFAPSSVQVCVEYSQDRYTDPVGERSKKLGTSACITFDDVAE